MTHIHLTIRSRNEKTGNIPVSTSHASTCATSCMLHALGVCYAKHGKLSMHWDKVTDEQRGADWETFLASVRKFPANQLWRHNQAGDLPGIGDQIDYAELNALVDANRGRRGFTYTHKPMATPAARDAIRNANASGFTINLSADTLGDADKLSDLGIAPVVVVLPSDQTTATTTPAGRRVAICPATISESVTCKTCGICALAGRKSIIGFPAHGAAKRKASVHARGA